MLQIGRNSSGVFGDTVLYALSNTGLGWPPNQPLGWVRGDVFEMLPFPQVRRAAYTLLSISTRSARFVPPLSIRT